MRWDCHTRKFLKTQYPSDEVAKEAAVAFSSKCEQMVAEFDSFKGSKAPYVLTCTPKHLGSNSHAMDTHLERIYFAAIILPLPILSGLEKSSFHGAAWFQQDGCFEQAEEWNTLHNGLR